jgi:hypothetical protein
MIPILHNKVEEVQLVFDVMEIKCHNISLCIVEKLSNYMPNMNTKRRRVLPPCWKKDD